MMNVLLVIAGAAGLLIWGIKGSMGSKNVFRNKRLLKWVLISYAIVLVASVFIFEMLPKKENEFAHAKSEEKLNQEIQQLDEAIFNGRTDEVAPRFKRKEWKWEFSGKELEIQSSDGWIGTNIIVEKKPKNDGIIEGTYYANTVINGVDFTNEDPSKDVRLDKNTLELTGTWKEDDFKFTVYEKEFVITQFNGERKELNFQGYSEVNYLYLKVPKDLKLIPVQDDVNIDYIGEDE